MLFSLAISVPSSGSLPRQHGKEVTGQTHEKSPHQACPYTAPVQARFSCLNFTSLLLVVGLLGCNRSTDTFDPKIVILQPAGAVVTREQEQLVKGYVWDDQGVAKLMAEDKKDVLDPSAKGKKIARFSFTAKIGGEKGTLELRATDINGRSSIKTLKLSVDKTAPKIKVTSMEALPDGVAVTGEVSDNVAVAELFIEGKTFNVSPADTVPFYTVVPYTRSIKIEAKDRVGNDTVEYFTPPARPAPEPVLNPTLQNGRLQTGQLQNGRTQLQNGQTQTTTTTRRRRRRRVIGTTTTQTQTAPSTTGTTR